MNGIYNTKRLGNALQQSLAAKLSREEFLTLKLIGDWELIAKELALISIPLRVYLKQETVILSVKPGYAMTLQYQNEKICRLINNYLGKKYINNIMVKTSLNFNNR